MRALVFLLILANLMFFAWTQGLLGRPVDPDAHRLDQQLLADQVRVVSRDTPPGEVAAKPAKTEKPEAEACLLLGDLSAAALERVETQVNEKLPGLRIVRDEAGSSGSYWVFIPPLANTQEAERKTAELKRLKVPEFYVVQEPAALRLAISLGIFSSREAAEARLEELRVKGVRSAKIGERDAKAALGGLEIHGTEAQIDVLRQASGDFKPKPRTMPCKAPRPAAL